MAELYSEIEKSQVRQEVKNVIDISDSFVSGLEEQLNIAQRILKIKEEEISGLNRKVSELTTRPMTPTSPAPRFDSYVESNVKESNQKITDLNKQLVDEREQNANLQMNIDDLNSQISTLQNENSKKTEDINRIEKEYEAEMLNMSANYKDQKALNCEELGQLTSNVEDLNSEIKDLERDNMYLREKYERVNQEHIALISQLENEGDGEGVQLHAIQAKCNLKEQQLNNALNEIDVLRESLQAKRDAVSELEQTLSEQRGVNVNLQDLINELKDRCDVLGDKESEYQKQINGLCQTIKGYEADNDELQATLAEATQKQTMQGSHIQHSIRDLSSALQELKLSKESLKVDVQSDLNNIATQWSECVEEIRNQTLQILSSDNDSNPAVNSKISLIVSSIKKLQQNYLSIKSEVETLLRCDVNTIFPELKIELDKIVVLSAQKDERIQSLEEEVQKFKTTGKKIIDKLKKQVKDKDMMLKKMASQSGDAAVIALQDANTSITKQMTALERDNELLTTDISTLKEQSVLLETSLTEQSSISSEVETFIHQYQAIYQCQIIDNDFDICVFSTAASRMINLAQNNADQLQDMKSKDENNLSVINELSLEVEDLKRLQGSLTAENKSTKEGKESLQRNYDEVSDLINQRNNEIESLTNEVSSLRDLKSVLIARDGEITKLKDTVTSLNDDLNSTQQSLNNMNSSDSNKISILQVEMEEYVEKNKCLQWDVSNLTESLDCKQLEIKKLTDKLELLITDCQDKDASISELNVKCEELEQTLDTLTSQVSYLAEEKDSLEKSLLEKESELDQSVNMTVPTHDNMLKEALAAKTNECRKSMGIIKKFKMIKGETDKKCKSLEVEVEELQGQLSSAQEELARRVQADDKPPTLMECIEMTVEEVPEISVSVQSAVHAGVECVDDSLAITDTNSANVHSSSDHVAVSRGSDSQSADIIAAQESTISSLQAEVVHLYNELRLFEDSFVSKDDFISTLGEQLALSKQLLAETKQDCESRLVELQREHVQYDELVKRMQKEKEEWLEREKQLRAQASLTEAETVRLMSGKPPVQEQDAMSEVSHTSIMSHDTSFMSVSSIHRDMPNDVESLQAELMKKNKLAFLIKTKAKKLESRVKDAKREADKSRAHDRVKEKILAIETELSNVTAQLRNLSAGKKIESQTVKIDPKYVEEIEGRLKQSSEKYEQIMIEYQNHIRIKDDAIDEVDHLNRNLQDLEDQMQILQEDLRNKDDLLCEHINAAAEDDARNDAIRDKFAQQNDELGHLRDLNKKMKEALIEVTDESARIEQTYKSTMHELEEDADQLKCDNATLSNELTNCWAKIEDLEEQNQNYMNLLETAHVQLRNHGSNNSELDSTKLLNENLNEQLNQYANANQDLSERLSVSEREKFEVLDQLVEVKEMYDECLESKTVISSEKDKLLSLILHLESKIKESEHTLREELDSSNRTLSEFEACKAQLEALQETNAQLLYQLESASSSVESTKSALSSKLKHLQEEHSLVRNQLEESQFSVDSLQEQLNIATDEKTKTSIQLEKVHNQLNDILSDHEGCPATIASLENRCNSLEEEMMSNSELIESLKEEQNLIMESNMEVVREKDLEIERLNSICQDNAVVEETLTSVNVAVQKLEAEKERLELVIAEKTLIEENLKSELVVNEEAIENLKKEKDEAASSFSALKAGFETEITDKDASLKSLQDLIEETKVSLDELESSKSMELESANTRKQELENELSSSEKSISDLQRQIESLQGESSAASLDLCAKREQLEKELESVQSTKEELEKQVEELTATNAQNAERLHEAGYNLEQWAYYNETQQQIMTDLQSQVATLTEEAGGKSAELQDEIDKLNREIETLSTEKNKLDDELADLKNQNMETQSKIESLGSEVESLMSEKQVSSQKLEELVEKEINLNKEVEDSNNKLKISLEAQSNIETQISGLNTELLSLQEDRNQIAAENSVLKTKLEAQCNLESKISELNTELLSLTEDKNQIAAENSVLKTELKGFDGQTSEEMALLRLNVEEKEKCIQEITQKLEKTKSLLEEKDQQCSDMGEQLKELDNLKTSLSEKEQSIESLEKQLDDAYSGNEEALGVLNSQISSLNEKITNYEKENEQLSKSKDVLVEELAKLQDSVEESKNTVGRYEQMLAEWTQYGEQREVYVSTLSEQLAENQSIVEKLNQTSTEISQKYEALQEDLNQTQSHLTKTTEEKEAIARKTKGIMKAYKDTKIQIEKLKKDSQNKGTEVSEQLQAQINDLTIAQATLAEQNTVLSNERNELMSEVEHFEVEREFMTTLKDENTSLKQSILEQSQRIENLQSGLDRTNAVESELVSFKNAKDAVDNKLVECSDRISMLEKECAERETDCSEKEAVINDLTTKNDSMVCDLTAKLSEIEARDSEITELRSTHVQHHRLFEDLGLDFERISEILPKLVSDVSLSNTKLGSLQSQIESFIRSIGDQNLVEFSSVREQVPDRFSAITDKLVGLSKSLQLTEAELETLKSQTAELKEETVLLKSVKESLDDTDKTNDELRRKVEFLERDRSEHEHTVELLHKKFEENYQELASAKSILAKKETELSDVTNQFQSTINNLAAKEGKIKELELLIVEKDSEKITIQHNFDSQIKHFHQSSADLQNELLKRESELESLRADKSGLEEDLKIESNKLSSVVEEMDGYKSQILSLSTDLSGLQQEYELLSGKMNVTETEFESVSEQLSNKDSTIHHLEDEINSLKRRLDAANSPDKDEELLNAIRQKDDVIEEMRGELETLQRDFQLTIDNQEQQITAQFDSERSVLSNEIKTLQNNLVSLQSELDSKNEEVGILYGQINDINKQLQQSADTNSSLKAELEEVSLNMSETKERLQSISTHKEKIEAKMGDLLKDKQDLQTLCDSLSSNVQHLDGKNQELAANLSMSNLDRNVLQKSVSDQNKQDTDVLQTKITSLKELNKTLEQSLLNSEESIGEVTANYEQKCMEMSAVERDLSVKKGQIHDLKKQLEEAEGQLSEKVSVMSQLEVDFKKLIASNADLEEKLNNFSSEDNKVANSKISELKVDLEQALVDNQMLRDNNGLLVKNNTQLTDNYKQLHDSVSVFQQRDQYLNEMCQKLQSHTSSLEAHIKTITDDFSKKVADADNEKSNLLEQLSSFKSGSAVTPQVTELKDEMVHMRNSKEKLVSEVETYQARLQVATSRADALEKSLQEITARYNMQCGTVEKKTADLAKLMKQYKNIKQKLVNELNTRKSLVQETINGKEKVAIKFGEKSKRLRVSSYFLCFLLSFFFVCISGNK